MALTACSSSSKTPAAGPSGGASTSASSSGSVIKLGVINDSTGVAASGYQTTEKGIKAYVEYINGQGGVNGHKLSYVMADSTTTPAGALTAAQKLVQTDKVFAIVSMTSSFFGAEPYLLKAGVPVLGTGFDGPEWTVKSNTNLFTSLGVSDPATVYATTGNYMKAKGVTMCATVGYIESPSSSKSAAASAKSCLNAGLKSSGAQLVSFGSTDMAPVALKMKTAGVDGIWMGTVPNTGFSLAAALRQVGVTPKVFLMATGYGGDLLASSAAITAAQGFQFSSTGQAKEMNTAATQAFAKNLAAVGETRTPTWAEQNSYIATAAFVTGLKAAGTNPTRDSFMTAMRSVKGFDADGLLTPEKIDFSSYSLTQSCMWVVTLQAQKFASDAQNPYCGAKISSS
jgi:branched-chain amino acid transport system substrate-binding protein